MAEYLLIFLGGLLGSSHCVGMCGGFAMSIGLGHPFQTNIRRQLMYTLGRVCTYGLLGAIAGGVGRRAAQQSWLAGVPAWLAIAAGMLLIGQGLHTLGVRFWRHQSARHPCLAAGLFSPFLTRPGFGQVFLAGVATGFLPCGLLYGYLALAGSSGSVPVGGLLMTCFALGTAPLMLATGAGASLLTVAMRRHLFRAAAVCVMLTGLLSIVRGVQALQSAGRACPFCGPQARN